MVSKKNNLTNKIFRARQSRADRKKQQEIARQKAVRRKNPVTGIDFLKSQKQNSGLNLMIGGEK
jgi:hypothetical protein